MNHTSSKNPQNQKLLEECHELLAYKEIVLCWIPSHIGIQGNEMVDKQAKQSLSLEPTFFKIPFSYFKPSKSSHYLKKKENDDKFRKRTLHFVFNRRQKFIKLLLPSTTV